MKVQYFTEDNDSSAASCTHQPATYPQPDKVYPELVTKGAEGKVESVQYHELIPILLNEVQHQQHQLSAQSQQLTAQSRELAALKAQNQILQAALAQRDEEQRAQNAAVAVRLERLEAGAASGATVVGR